MNHRFFIFFLFLLLSACSNGIEAEQSTQFEDTATFPVSTMVLTPTPGIPTSSPDSRIPPERWQEWPVIPEELGQVMLEVYQRGLEQGNKPQAFSKIGDGEISTIWFLSHYDLGPDYFNLGIYTDLQPVIEYFSGSFGRASLAAGRGFNTTILLDPARAEKSQCLESESPLECELRLHQPSFAFVSLGTNQVWYPEIFEVELRTLVEHLLERGTVPILATKADNLEGDHRINLIIARLAYQYELPLWNFWQVVQALPAHGLQADLEHLTYAESDFSNPAAMQSAWPWRNLTALQTLQAVWQGVTGKP